MAAAANIVLADAQATPVNHTFIPLGPDSNGVWWFEDQSASTPIGYWKISFQLTRPGNPSAGSKSSTDRVSRLKLALHEPITETLGTNDAGITPAPTVSYVTRGMVEFVLPERNSLQNRKDVRKMLALLIGDAQVIAAVESLQAIY